MVMHSSEGSVYFATLLQLIDESQKSCNLVDIITYTQYFNANLIDNSMDNKQKTSLKLSQARYFDFVNMNLKIA